MGERIRIGISGALGRMGRAVADAVEASEGAVITKLFDRPGAEGQIINGADGPAHVLVTAAEALQASQVVVDFTTPEHTVALARRAAELRAPSLVLGATGLNAEQDAAIAAASQSVAIVRARNFSLGVNMLAGLVEEAARRLPAADWDIEIFEAHHRRKVDAPSGTAFDLGEAAALGRGVDLAAVSERGRDGITGARAVGAIGFSVLRGGGIIGEHSVSFVAEDEILTLSHSARNRSLFARGALVAAVWAAGKPPGLYTMKDVLGF